MLKNLLFAFLGGEVIYFLVSFINDLFLLSRIVVENNTPLTLSLHYIFLSFPATIRSTLPFAIVFSALFIILKMSSNSELTAVNASGMSVFRQSLPFSLFGFLFFFVYFGLSFIVGPYSNNKSLELLEEITSHSVLSTLEKSIFNQLGESNTFFYFTERKGNSFRDIALIQESKTGYFIAISKQASIKYEKESEKIELSLYNCNEYLITDDGNYSMGDYKSRRLTVYAPTQSSLPEKGTLRYYRNLNLKELLISAFSENSNIAKGIIGRRLMMAFFVLMSPLFAFLAGFSLKREKSYSGAFLYSFLSAFLYQFLVKFIEDITVSSGNNPLVTMPLLGILFIMLITILYVRLYRPQNIKDSSIKNLIKSFNILNIILVKIDKSFEGVKSKTLGAYITSGMLKAFAIVFIMIEGFLVLMLSLAHISYLMKFDEREIYLFKFIFFSIPSTIPIALPFSYLISVLFYFIYIESKKEITAIKSLGISVFEITKPVIKTSLILSIVVFIFTSVLSPYSAKNARISKEMLKSRSKNFANTKYDDINLTNIYRSLVDNSVCYQMDSFNEFRSEVSGFKSFKINWETYSLFWFYSAEKIILKDNSLSGKDIFIHFTEKTSNLKKIMVFDNISFFKSLQPIPEEMNILQLLKFIKDRKRLGIRPLKYITDYYYKYAQSLAPLVLLLMGLPFAFRSEGRSQNPAGGVALAIVLVILYYALSSIFISLGTTGFIPPFIAAWMVNLMFIVAGLYMYLGVKT